jgi:hypothetical protein
LPQLKRKLDKEEWGGAFFMQKLTLRVALVFSVDGGDHQEEVDFEMVCFKKMH